MAANGKEEWKSAMDRAEDLLEQGRKEMLKAAEMAKEKGDEAWEEAQQAAKATLKNARAKSAEFWEETKDRSERLVKDARDYGEDVVEDLERLVRKHPARSVGLTLLVGVLIGTLLTRSDRD